MTGHGCRDHGGRWRDPPLAALVARAAETVPAPARGSVAPPDDRRPAARRRPPAGPARGHRRRHGSALRRASSRRSSRRRPSSRNRSGGTLPRPWRWRSTGSTGPADEPMLVLPADHRIADEATFRGVLAGAVAVTRLEPDALLTLGIEPTGPEPGYGYVIADGDRREVAGVVRFGVDRFVEKPAAPAAQALLDGPRPASWNAGIFVWRRAAIRSALERFAPDIAAAVATGIASDALDEAYASVRATSIDYAVMEPASAAGLVRVIQMDVGWSDLGSWTALLGALGGSRRRPGDPGGRASHGRPRRPRRRADRRTAHPPRRSPRYPRPDARRPVDGGPPRSRRRRCVAPSGRSTGGVTVTNIAEAPAPTNIVFGTDGWRAKIADEYTFDNVRRCADGVARYVVDRGEQAKGVVIAYDRRFASEHFAAAAAEVLLARDIPVAYASHAVPTQMSSYEVVERGAAAGIVITASHNPWTDNGFKVKAPTGSAAGPEILSVLEAAIAGNGGRAIERRPFADAEAAGLVERFDPFEGYERYVRRTVDLDALRAADVSILVEPMWGAGAGWISRLLSGGTIRVTELHQERNPYFGGVNPEPIRPNVDEALGLLARRRLRPRADARRRRRPRRRGRREGQLHPPARGHRAADVLPRRVSRDARPGRHQRQQHVDGAPARRALRHRDLRDLGRVQVHRPEDDRDRGDDGRRGIGRLRLRDAPAGARRRLRRPPAARPVPAREGGRPVAGVRGPRRVPRARRPVVLPPRRRPRRPGRLPRAQGPAARRAARPRAGRAGRGARSAGPRRSTRTTASSSTSPTARGCSSGSAAPSRSSGSTPRRPRPTRARR